MPAGFYPAGFGPAGSAPVSAPSAVPGIVTPAAAKFDLATRSFPVVGSQLVPVHPVDQAVALALGVSVSAISSATNTGNGLRSLTRGSDAAVTEQAKDRVRIALAPWIDGGDIVVTDVTVLVPARGRVEVYVSYVNQHTSQNTTAKAAI